MTFYHREIEDFKGSEPAEGTYGEGSKSIED